jgi:hypothetical protein
VGDRVSEQLTLHDVATQRAGVAGEGRGLWLWGILDWRNEGEEGPRAFTLIVAESDICGMAKALPVSTWDCAEGPE